MDKSKTLYLGIFVVVSILAIFSNVYAEDDRHDRYDDNTQEVEVVNTLDVNVVNVPGVMIENTDPIEVTTQSHPRRVYMQSQGLRMEEGSTNTYATFDVPTDGTLVIEQISITYSYELARANIDIIAGLGERVSHTIPLQYYQPGGSTDKYSRGSLHTRLYAPVGALVSVYIDHIDNGAVGSKLGTASISGYVVPTGSASLAP